MLAYNKRSRTFYDIRLNIWVRRGIGVSLFAVSGIQKISKQILMLFYLKAE